jgi:hypothetical protein
VRRVEAVQELHDRCAIYTSSSAAGRLLDVAGWTKEADLSGRVLLEPCVGEGAILLEGIRRLLASFLARGQRLTEKALLPRIKGFELHAGAAASARRNVRLALMEQGIAWDIAGALADAWVAERDFLLEQPGRATHIVANPPYVRWSKLPVVFADAYREALPSLATRGDLAVAFLYRMQDWADAAGVIAALVSDRWMFAQYGAAFVHASSSRGWHLEVVDDRPDEPFVRQVGAYSAIVRFARTSAPGRSQAVLSSRSGARDRHAALLERHGSLTEAGCTVRVGPALGAGKTFLIKDDEAVDVEQDLIRTFVTKSDLGADAIESARQRVIVPYDRSGGLIDIAAWPRFETWARRHETVLRQRSQFVGSSRYWRTIDAIPAVWSEQPKLLMSELSNCPRVVLDLTDSIPAHSIYAIWPGRWPIRALQRVLNGGLLELTAAAEAPRMDHGWVRFYKRFIVRTPLPCWDALTEAEQMDLSDTGADFERRFLALFGFPPGNPLNK